MHITALYSWTNSSQLHYLTDIDDTLTSNGKLPFAAYKAKALSEPTLRRFIGAESDAYPKSVLEKIIK